MGGLQGERLSTISAEERLRIATSAARIGVWEWNLEDNSMIYSEIAKAIFGLTPGEPVTYEQVKAVTHPADFPRTSAAAARALDPGIRENVVYRYRALRADTGEERWILAYGEAQFDHIGGKQRAVRYIGTVQDITEQHEAAERLAESEARLRLAIDAAQMAVWELDVDTDTILGSVELNRLCGFPEGANPTAEEIRARHAPGERERLAQEGAKVLARGEDRIQTEFRQVWPDGTEKWLLLRAQIAPSATGGGRRVIGVLMDITERKRQEEQLAMVSHELRHRIKNSLTVVAALARQAIASKEEPHRASEAFMSRVSALGKATDIIFKSSGETADLGDLLTEIASPYVAHESPQITIEGPPVEVPSHLATKVALAVHELLTNAVKYGALAGQLGHVDIRWTLLEARLSILWQERGGPPVAPPARPGFGSRLLSRGIFSAPDRAVVTFDPEGVRCEIVLHLEA